MTVLDLLCIILRSPRTDRSSLLVRATYGHVVFRRHGEEGHYCAQIDGDRLLVSHYHSPTTLKAFKKLAFEENFS